jgi:hypothetical protein
MPSTAPLTYHIRVKGEVDASWFDGMLVRVESHAGMVTTLATGYVTDQAALYGLINRLGSLGLTLLLVECIP